MNSQEDVLYSFGGIELLDRIEPLWLDLIAHHSRLSQHFSDMIGSSTFPDRRTGLISKSRNGALRVDLAEEAKTGNLIGYCVSTLDAREQPLPVLGHRSGNGESLSEGDHSRR